MEMLILIVILVAIGAVFGYALLKVWGNATRRVDPPPLLSILDSSSPAQAQASPEATAVALRRCTFCASGEHCRQLLAAGQPIPEYCPNTAFLERLARLRAS